MTDKKDDSTIAIGTPQTLAFRYRMIKMGLEAELKGMRLTSRAPACFTIIKNEFGIKAKRGPTGKWDAYVAYCARFGFEPKASLSPVPVKPTIIVDLSMTTNPERKGLDGKIPACNAPGDPMGECTPS